MLRFDSATKSFGTRRAVDDLTLSINPGEVFGLLGPNGAGKTTSIQLATGLLRPDSGSVTLGDLGPPTTNTVRASMGVCPQSIALYEDLTARENLLFIGKIHGLKKPHLAKRADELLAQIGLTDRAADRVKSFSGGMKRRLNIAAAIVHRPPLVLLDEPTVGVDPHSRHAIFELVQSMKNEGVTVVYTTHYMEEAQRLCDRVGIIDQGKLIALDRVESLITQHGGHSIVVLERTDTEERHETQDALATVAAAVREPAGADLLGVRVERPNLEAVFLNLTGRRLRD